MRLRKLTGVVAALTLASALGAFGCSDDTSSSNEWIDPNARDASDTDAEGEGGKPDGGDIGDTDGRADAPYSDDVRTCEDGPVDCCTEEVNELMTYNPADTHSIPFELHKGAQPPGGETVTGTWRGMEALAQPIEVDCPANADELGLPCEVTQVAVFDNDNGERYKFIIGLPDEVLDALPEDVEAEFRFEQMRKIFRRASDGMPLIVIGGMTYHSHWAWEEGPLDAGPFTYGFGGFEEDVDDSFCLRDPDECNRVFVAERLALSAESEHLLEPGESIDFQAGGASYRVWHVVSKYRYMGDKYGPASQCADGAPEHLSFAAAKIDAP